MRVRGLKPRPFLRCSARLKRLLKKSMAGRFEGAHLQVRRCKSFIFVIPNRLQSVRDPLFRLFQQPVTSCPDTDRSDLWLRF